MQTTFDITDGTTTVNLAESGQKLLKYELGVSPDAETVQGSARIVIVGATAAAAKTTFQTINKLFRQARRYEEDNKACARVYLYHDPGNIGTNYRSPVKSGSARIDWNATVGPVYDGSTLFVDIEFERYNYWEGALTECALSTGGAYTTGAKTLTMKNNTNFVGINDGGVTGDLPAPAKITLYHSFATDPYFEYLWLYHKTDYAGDFVAMLEGEDGTGGSTSADSGASGGDVQDFSWTSADLEKLWEITLGYAAVNDIAHARIQFLSRFDQHAYTDLYLQWILRNETGYTFVDQTSLTQFPASQCFHEGGTLRIPPGLSGGTNANYILELWAQRISGSATALSLDFVQLSPIAYPNSYRKFVAADTTTGLKYQEYLVDDPVEGLLYRIKSSKRITDWTVEGGPIMLATSGVQRLYLHVQTNGEAYYDDATLTIQVHYRPRFRYI